MDVEQHKLAAYIGMKKADTIMILASKSYLEGLLEGDEKILAEVNMSEKSQKPVIILYKDDLSKEEIDLLKNTYFSRLNVRGEKVITERYLEDKEFTDWMNKVLGEIKYEKICAQS